MKAQQFNLLCVIWMAGIAAQPTTVGVHLVIVVVMLVLNAICVAAAIERS